MRSISQREWGNGGEIGGDGQAGSESTELQLVSISVIVPNKVKESGMRG